jgi:hypothetical protein
MIITMSLTKEERLTLLDALAEYSRKKAKAKLWPVRRRSHLADTLHDRIIAKTNSTQNLDKG